MTILAIADRPARESIKTILSRQPVDLICTLGDLGYYELIDLQYVTDIPKIGIYGNHCSGNYFDQLGIQNMHLRTWEFQGLTFGGFEGSVRYKESATAKMYTQEEAQVLLKDFSRVDVMLVHCPPYGVNDDTTDLAHTGFLALRDYIERQQPTYIFHGHTYPTTETLVTKYLNTNIVYVYQDKIVSI